MIGLSRTTGYAIQTLRCLADSSCATRSLTEIARCSPVPRPYLAKIVKTLARQKIVVTKRGVGGGIVLARPPETIQLLQIVEAIEGREWIADCLLNLGENECGDACPTKDFWERIRSEIEAEFRAMTLADVLAARRSPVSRPAQEACCCAQ